ncbi:MAG: hypothetical protein WCP01_04640 [Methylococcaceae bacterium]
MLGGSTHRRPRPTREGVYNPVPLRAETEIRQVGMLGLKKALGTVETERFVAALTRDRFDYTEWRKTSLPNLDIETLSTQAMPHAGRGL